MGQNTICSIGTFTRNEVELAVIHSPGEVHLFRADRPWDVQNLLPDDDATRYEDLLAECRAAGEFDIADDPALFDWPDDLDAHDLPTHASFYVGEQTIAGQFMRELPDWDLLADHVQTFHACPPDPGPTVTDPRQVREKLDAEGFFYDKGRKEYLLRNQRGWLALTEGQFKKELALRGWSDRKGPDDRISPADKVMISIRDEKDLDYAGPLAGYEGGTYEQYGKRILVTESRQLPTATPGEWSILRAVIENMLRDPEHDQTVYLYGWLKIAYESLLSKKLRPGQALAIAGPRESGKSLLQQIISVALGGRFAKPYAYLTGLTDFNGDFFTAEHLIVEDEPSTTDIRMRRSFGAQLKQITANDGQRCHKKGRDAVTLNPFWRLSITLNDEPENLSVLPPIDDSIEDKIILLRATSCPMPWPTQTSEQRAAFWARLSGEVPALLNHLLGMAIPAHLKSERFGVRHFHHPAILAELDSLAPETRLLSLIDESLFQLGFTTPDPWEGTAEALEKALTEHDAVKYDARRLLHWQGSCGTYLHRLSKKHPDRIKKNRKANSRNWVIIPQTMTP